eukprot:5246758-Lingulodinium_polyedra.AAC.1
MVYQTTYQRVHGEIQVSTDMAASVGRDAATQVCVAALYQESAARAGQLPEAGPRATRLSFA